MHVLSRGTVKSTENCIHRMIRPTVVGGTMADRRGEGSPGKRKSRSAVRLDWVELVADTNDKTSCVPVSTPPFQLPSCVPVSTPVQRCWKFTTRTLG